MNPGDTDPNTIRWRDGGGQFGMTPIWILTAPDIHDRATRMYGILAARASWQDGRLRIAVSDIASLMGCSVRTAQRAQQNLIDAGALEIRPESHSGMQGWNVYLLGWHQPAEATGKGDSHDTPLGTLVATGRGDNRDTPGVTTVTPPLHTPISQTTSGKILAVPGRSDYWDQLEGVFGYRPVKGEAALWGKVVNHISERGDLPSEIPRRALLWQYHYSTPLTPATLLNKWDWLGGATASMSEQDRGKLRQILATKANESEYWGAVERSQS